MDLPTSHPAALKRGSTIGIIAPAGPLEKPEVFLRGVAALERLGFVVRFDDRIFESQRYLAGSDEHRAAELMRYFQSPEINAVISLRGGYGCSRLLPFLDEGRLRPNCKVFMGFSDLTTLHLFFRRRLGWITLHGPMVATEPMAQMSPDQEEHLVRLWTDPDYRPVFSFPELQSWHPGVAEGGITGGCLSIMLASLGTCYEVQTAGKVLFMEELDEAPYRIDRMITQLRLAGKLDDLAAILLGSFEGCNSEKGDYKADDILRELLDFTEVPIIAGFPAGHGSSNWPFPLGLPVRIDAERRTVQMLEPYVR